MHPFYGYIVYACRIKFSLTGCKYVYMYNDSVNVQIFDMCNMSTSVILQVNLYAKSVQFTYENMNASLIVILINL